MLKRILSLICAVACLVNVPLTAFATTFSPQSVSFVEDVVSRVSKIDLTSGKITGEKAQFYFTLPSTWRDSVTADRENNPNSPIVEQINFYCSAVSGLYKPQLLFSLYVMDRRLWTESSEYELVMKSKNYVFVVKYGTNGFALSGDIAVYKSKLDPVSNVGLIKKCIQLPQGQEVAYERTVLIDGVPAKHRVELIDSIYYVNLRDVCDAFGYKIEWVNSSRSIFIHSDSFDDMFKIDTEKWSDSRGIKMRIINDMTYVSTSYFYRVMKKNIEIDQYKNIYIYSK